MRTHACVHGERVVAGEQLGGEASLLPAVDRGDYTQATKLGTGTCLRFWFSNAGSYNPQAGFKVVM